MDHRGFTLVELIIVIAIIAIVGTISIPSFLRYSINANLKSAAREIASDILQSRARAISENRRQRIVFDMTNESYTLEERDDADSSWINPQTKTLSSFDSSIDINNSTFAGNTIILQTRGTSTTGTLTLINSRGSVATLTMYITGRPYVDVAEQ